MEFLILLFFGLPVVLLVTALVLALQARSQAEELRRRTSDLNQRLARLEALQSSQAAERGESEEPGAPRVSVQPPVAQEAPPAKIAEPRSVPAQATPPLAEAPTPAEFPQPAGLPPPVAAPRLSLEERVGARLYVWIGALAVACAGVFLVKYSIDRNLLSPAVRVILGALLGAGLLVLGERWRGRNLGAAVSAAGVADLFACLLAAVHLYGLIGASVGFVLMIALTALAIWLSLRQGAAVALLGLAGGFITPALLGSEEPRALPLFTWFLVLQGALLFVARSRNWWWIGWLSVLAALAWAALWLFGAPQPLPSPWLGPYLLGSLALTIAATVGAEPARAWQPLRWAAVLAVLPLLALLVHGGGFSTIDWAYLGCASVGLVVFARLRESEQGLGWLGLVAQLAALASAHVEMALSPERGATLALCFGIATALCAYVGAWRSRSEGGFAALAVCALLAHLLLAWWGLEESDWTELVWALAALAIALACAGAVWAALRRRGDSDRHA
ncbi:MAG: DUF2339 domain-containing protein, partial [Planctomycetes bacterium]|nr:DUF2339 domain-containing protein [Planctomycetota bacterium]